WVSRVPAVVVRPRPSAEPVSVAERDYFRRPAFHVRVGAIGLFATTLFAILFFRLWSLEVIQGRQFAHAVQAQAVRTVHFATSRVLSRRARARVSRLHGYGSPEPLLSERRARRRVPRLARRGELTRAARTQIRRCAPWPDRRAVGRRSGLRQRARRRPRERARP